MELRSRFRKQPLLFRQNRPRAASEKADKDVTFHQRVCKKNGTRSPKGHGEQGRSEKGDVGPKSSCEKILLGRNHLYTQLRES